MSGGGVKTLRALNLRFGGGLHALHKPIALSLGLYSKCIEFASLDDFSTVIELVEVILRQIYQRICHSGRL